MENTSEQHTKQPTRIVGVGASAGGLEALQEFFTYLPEQIGIAFIVVQHLSPDYKSKMSELLKKCTSMPILEIEDKMVVKPDIIYLAPPRRSLNVSNGMLMFVDQMHHGSPNMSIDTFFCSLAEEQKQNAIAIVLSGTGSDGTRGIRAVKEAGGVAIVQKPGSAKFDGMPINAYNTGLIDMVLLPKEMGQALQSLVSHPSVLTALNVNNNELFSRNDTLAEIFQLLKEKSTIDFSAYKPTTISRRIGRRLSINQLDNLGAYLKLLSSSPRELQILSKELLIGVTRFFRDDEAFERLRIIAIPAILNTVKQEDIIRIWVAGCSSGEEAYSIAILFREALDKREMFNELKIYATDIDENAIAVASAGCYEQEVVKDIPSEYQTRYFSRTGDKYFIDTDIRKSVVFAVHNMIEDPPFSNMHLISCRNSLIYFQQSAQQKALTFFYFALQSSGYLFLGDSESPGEMRMYFETVEERLKLYKKVSSSHLPVPENKIDKIEGLTKLISMRDYGNHQVKKWMVNPLDLVRDRLVSYYAPDCIVLNESFEAIHVYGNVAQYTNRLKHGRVSCHINDMIIEPLAIAITTALHRCEKSEEDVFYKDVVFEVEGEVHTIDLAIFYTMQHDLQNAQRHYIVQFIEKHIAEPESSNSKITFNATEQSRQRILDLEQELIKKQEHLLVTVEELETTNEELQSANEELMSANEELQSTNEELQSVNEELYTVNSENQEQIRQLTEANNDLDSVINATDIGIVFLDENLAIRKFTPHSRNYINVMSSDIGRPIHHISHNLDFDDFLTQIAAVSGTEELVEKDVMTRNGQAVLLRIMPYAPDKKQGQVNKGVLITITNISRLRVVENALNQAQQQFKSLLMDRSERLQRRVSKKPEVSLLILEDDTIFRKSVTRDLKAIEGRKFNIMEAEEVATAIDMVRHVKVDVCLVDYTLCGETAEDFAKALHDNKLELPILLLTVRDERDIDEQFLRSEVIDFLNKDSLTAALLERCIDHVIERKTIKDIVEQFRI